MRVNVRLHMRDRGKIVPGSRREGHNVFTYTGRDWMAQLVAWDPTTDSMYSHDRIRWMGAGSGIQPEIPAVLYLDSPLEVTSGVYLAPLVSGAATFPNASSVKLTHEFAASELSFGGTVMVSELALYVDEDAANVDPALTTNAAAFYKTFDPVAKLSSFSLEVIWELKF